MARSRTIWWRWVTLLTAGTLALLVGSQAPANAHHGGWHTLQMVSLTCHLNTDAGDDEEPYLKLNGDRFWSHSDCAPGMRVDLNGVARSFFGNATLELMEDDFGPDQNVLAMTVGPEANAGVQSRTAPYRDSNGVTRAWMTLEWYVTG